MIKFYKRPTYMVGEFSDGTKFYFDESDLETFKRRDLRKDRYGYLAVKDERNIPVRIHRILLGLTKYDKVIVDHINRNALDNRRCNLRICTNAENLRNRKISKLNTTGTTGVYRCGNGKYFASIGIDGKEVRIGTYIKIEDAIRARKDAEEKYYGKYKPQSYSAAI